jgi:hypothetical protein
MSNSSFHADSILVMQIVNNGVPSRYAKPMAENDPSIALWRLSLAGRRSWGPGDRGTGLKTESARCSRPKHVEFQSITAWAAYLCILQGTLLQDLLDHLVVNGGAKLVL